MITRVLLAVLVAAAAALVGGLLSDAMGLNFWPGTIGAFVVGVPLFLYLARGLP